MSETWLDAGSGNAIAQSGGTTTDSLTLQDEVDTIAWIFQEVRDGRALPIVEAEAVAASLALRVGATGGQRVIIVPQNDMSMYHAVHAVNVAALAMTLAQQLDYDNGAVRRIGAAALIHDIGMTRVPANVISKAGQISTDERDRVMAHPIEGARIIMAADISMDLAATVAFEHHLKTDGSGYPKLLFPRAPHYVSRLIQVCDVFHALSSPRPFRPAWPLEIIVSYLSARAGFEFHPALTSTLTTFVTRDAPPKPAS